MITKQKMKLILNPFWTHRKILGSRRNFWQRRIFYTYHQIPKNSPKSSIFKRFSSIFHFLQLFRLENDNKLFSGSFQITLEASNEKITKKQHFLDFWPPKPPIRTTCVLQNNGKTQKCTNFEILYLTDFLTIIHRIQCI